MINFDVMDFSKCCSKELMFVLKGKFSSGTEGTQASKSNYDFE